MFTLQLILEDGSIIVSPPIAPNNPNKDYNDLSIPKVIHNTGISMVKRLKDVVSYKCITVEV